MFEQVSGSYLTDLSNK